MKHDAPLSRDPPLSGSSSTNASVEPDSSAHRPGHRLGSAASRQPLASSLPQACQSVQEQLRGSVACGLDPHRGAQPYQKLRAVVRLTRFPPAPDPLLPQIGQTLMLHTGFAVASVRRRAREGLPLAADAVRPPGSQQDRSADALKPGTSLTPKARASSILGLHRSLCANLHAAMPNADPLIYVVSKPFAAGKRINGIFWDSMKNGE